MPIGRAKVSSVIAASLTVTILLVKVLVSLLIDSDKAGCPDEVIAVGS